MDSKTKRPLIMLAAALSGLYMINPTFGLFEFIPDNLPFIGNLDEGMAAYVLFSSIAYLMGRDIGLFKHDGEGDKAVKEMLGDKKASSKDRK